MRLLLPLHPARGEGRGEGGELIELKLLSRPGCHLCEEMRSEVDGLLSADPHRWEIVDVDSDDEIARRWSDSIPVLFVNGRLFAKVKLPKLAARLRLMRAATGENPR